ncbi:MAG TPA: dihydropteroate synthase [Spirochaetia bacterium]|nr:dihydropteroate synthase [Spirochaetales bacterium]HPD80023.1 dihydropteroate synthase [Spirochaetales bacterium]HQK33582.1 dihydropteroate synthase [Spirochaetales bacterium]HRS66701.1 dihydropteroate synthase [Spirochaetia bacterium]HRV27950.1 dihydropteroate synthase [Spirochaetia bacterium]
MKTTINTRYLRLPRNRVLELQGFPAIMGILNVTPDSFFDGSRVTPASIVDAAASMISSGAAILDIGGESSRPGAEYVDADTELARVIPAIEAVRSRWDIPISIDTRKSVVAEEALRAGADIVNDISALGEDPELATVCARYNVPVILMHKKGIPATMQDKPYYEDCVREVLQSLLTAAQNAEAHGIVRDAIVIDPGIGFGKRLDDNIALMQHIPDFVATGYPVLIGISRKSTIGAITGKDPHGRLPGSLGAACWAAEHGAAIIRVHDVAETVDALKVYLAFKGVYKS